ncbi:MAG: helix-turn-helix transcriptional regulator [Candidatus Gastranaerophilaceae bacterium]|jgi:transcriptional regulator with XRE-family HTH domain
MSKRELKAFGKKLRELRLERGLTQEELAESLNLSANFVGMVERGERNTSLLKVFKIAKTLEVKTSELFVSD